MHFQTWSDKAGNSPPLIAVDPLTGVSVSFPDLNSSPLGWRGFPDESHHAGIVPVHQPQPPALLGHSPHGDKWDCNGRRQFPDEDGALHRLIIRVFQLYARSGEDADAARRG